MLNVHTAFGDPLRHGWPWPATPFPHAPGGVLHSDLVTANLVSAARLAVGFGISIVLGAVLGTLMWRFRALDEFLGPLFLGMQTLPSVCWVPLGIIAFGISERAVQFVLVMGFVLRRGDLAARRAENHPAAVPPAGLMLGAGGWKLYRYVLIPASLPALSSGLRQGFSFAWRSLMGAEFVFVVERHGLGFLLQTGRDFNDVAQVMAVMIVMVVLGMLADRLAFARLERRIYKRFGLGAAH